jgi:hypothetical protein
MDDDAVPPAVADAPGRANKRAIYLTGVFLVVFMVFIAVVIVFARHADAGGARECRLLKREQVRLAHRRIRIGLFGPRMARQSGASLAFLFSTSSEHSCCSALWMTPLGFDLALIQSDHSGETIVTTWPNSAGHNRAS